jgi:hypothetical protein
MPIDCFETFPSPQNFSCLEDAGEVYLKERSSIMLQSNQGLTATYNRFNCSEETGLAIVRMRELHVTMDRSVAVAYGWNDIDLCHGFCETPQGERFAISNTARVEILDRLLDLNHERYAEEGAVGLYDKGSKSRRKGRAKARPKRSGVANPTQLDLI